MAPSDKHIALTHESIGWLARNRSSSGVRAATEFSWFAEGKGVIYDAAALCWYARRDLLKIVGNEYANCRFDLKDPGPTGRGNYVACVFETKVSRSDYLSTFGPSKQPRPLAGNLHWIVLAKKVASPSEIPSPWGALVEFGRGPMLRLREVKRPSLVQVNRDQLAVFTETMLWLQGRKREGFIPPWQDLEDLDGGDDMEAFWRRRYNMVKSRDSLEFELPCEADRSDI